MDGRLRADVDTLSGLVQDDDAGPGGQPLGDHHLLLVSTRQQADVLIQAGRAQVQPLRVFAGQREFPRQPQEPAPACSGQRRQGDVLKDRQALDRALPAPVLGDIDDAGGHSLRSGSDDADIAFDPAGALCGLGDAEQCLHHLGPAGADQTVKAQNLSAVQGEGDVLEFGRVTISRDGQHRRADLGGAFGIDLIDAAADHQLDQLAFGDVGNRALRHEGAVAEHRPAVGDAEDLVELVADEQDGLALGLERFNQIVKLCDLLVGEGSGWFVHDDHACIDRQGAGDGHQVLAGNAQVAQPRVGVQIRPDAAQDRRGAGAHCAAVDKAPPGAGRVADKDVLGHGHLVEKHGLLMDRGDAGRARRLRCRKTHRLSGDQYLALVGLIDAGQHLDDGRFARAVLSDQGGDLAREQVQLHAVQCAHAGECLDDVAQRQHRAVPRHGFCLHIMSLGKSAPGANRGREAYRGFRTPTRIRRCCLRHR